VCVLVRVCVRVRVCNINQKLNPNLNLNLKPALISEPGSQRQTIHPGKVLLMCC